ncbi:MAG TPA: methyltransferase domain-containing protein [Longimicrobiales bacterium]|nr:methyltransferase domain-containing protein [Longimicrobiales bacterium]
MKTALLDWLACPACHGDLQLESTKRDGAEIMEGQLRCTGCAQRYPVAGGVPRFAETMREIEERTAQAFGYEWTRYSELAQRYRQQFLDWIRPVTPEFFRNRLVLEGGCGKGRHTALAAEFGARAVVALDLSEAVDAAFANTRHLENVHVVQGDLNRPPVKPVFDYAFSIGVLHHLPEPERGFQALVSRLRPGGSISAWVYGREGNGWIVHIVSPLRERLTSHLPHAMLDLLSAGLTVPLYVATKLVYRPTGGTWFNRLLPYAPYLTYISTFPYREQRSIVFDHLVAPGAYYLRKAEFAGWFERAGLHQVSIEHHNANSWRGFGSLPSQANREVA